MMICSVPFVREHAYILHTLTDGPGVLCTLLQYSMMLFVREDFRVVVSKESGGTGTAHVHVDGTRR